MAGGGGESAYRTAKTSVWWDIENCHVPRGSDAHVIAQNISSALADVGYKGAVTISAYGDTNKIPTAVQQALSSTGIALNHVPAGVKDASDKKILVDMLFWAVDNPPPSNYLLISGDRDFSNALHQLRMRRYNILLAHAPNVSQALVAAANSVWLWTSLLSGGPPMQDPTQSFSDSGKKYIRDTTPLKESSSTKNEDNSDYRSKSQSVSRTSSLPEIKEGCDAKFQKQMSLPVTSSCDLSEGKQFNKLPHEFFGANKPRASIQPPYLGGAINYNYQQTKYAQSVRPSNVPPTSPHSPYSNSHDYSSYRPPHQQRPPPPFMLGPPPDFNRLKISDYPSNTYQNSPFPPSYVDNRPPSGIQELIGSIQGALNELKANKMTPTEANIADCIQYGMHIRNFNVKMGLNCALEHNVIVMHKLGFNLPFYTGKTDKLWKCVNPLDSNVRHPESTLDAVQNFLSSARGQAAISSSECRYHAGTILKKECLGHLVLGDVLQILSFVVQVKKWIVPSSYGWQPLSFTLKVAVAGSNASVSAGTNMVDNGW